MTKAHIDAATRLPERGRQDRDLRQRALVEAATALFAEHGFEAATTHEVAERAGCAEGLIHRYFGGKQGLLVAVMQSKQQYVSEEFERAIPRADDLETEIATILVWQLDQMWQVRDFMAVCVSESVIHEELGRLVGEGIDQKRVDLIIERLERHREAGRIVPEADLHAIAHALTALGFASGFFAQVVFQRDRSELRDHLRYVARLMAQAISPNHASKGASTS